MVVAACGHDTEAAAASGIAKELLKTPYFYITQAHLPAH